MHMHFGLDYFGLGLLLKMEQGGEFKSTQVRRFEVPCLTSFHAHQYLCLGAVMNSTKSKAEAAVQEVPTCKGHGVC